MKKMFVMTLLSALAVTSYGAIKCEPDGKGGVCCWDTATDGIFRPIGC